MPEVDTLSSISPVPQAYYRDAEVRTAVAEREHAAVKDEDLRNLHAALSRRRQIAWTVKDKMTVVAVLVAITVLAAVLISLLLS